jgi:hypothetical protein
VLPLAAARPLPMASRHRMEARFGTDFSQVRVHDDRQAGVVAGSARAAAFTIGEQIVFAPGRFQPGTAAGDRLLAHELAHVAQQRTGRADADGERRADRAADRVISGGTATDADLGGAPPGLARQPDDAPLLRQPVLETFAGFAPGSAALTAADQHGVPLAADLAGGVAMRLPGRVVLTGHSAPGEPTGLGDQRAVAVAAALAKSGVPVGLIHFAPSTPGGRSVEITISGSVTPGGSAGQPGLAAAPGFHLPPGPPPIFPPSSPAPPRPLPPFGAAPPASAPQQSPPKPLWKPTDDFGRPNPPRPGTAGDLGKAMLAVPEVKEAVDRLRAEALRQWHAAPTSAKAAALTAVGVIALPPVLLELHEEPSAWYAASKLGSGLIPTIPVDRLHLRIHPEVTLAPRTGAVPGPRSNTFAGPLIPPDLLSPEKTVWSIGVTFDLSPLINGPASQPAQHKGSDAR